MYFFTLPPGGQGGSMINDLKEEVLQANLNNDVNILDEVSSLLKEIKTGWDAIPAEYHNPAQ